MTKDATQQPEIKKDSQAIDNDNDDIFEEGDLVSLSESLDKETIKRDTRRKIEIIWEKKRLKEQFDDFDESEFDF